MMRRVIRRSTTSFFSSSSSPLFLTSTTPTTTQAVNDARTASSAATMVTELSQPPPPPPLAVAVALSWLFSSMSRHRVLLSSTLGKQQLPAREEAVAAALHRSIYRLSTTSLLADQKRWEAEQQQQQQQQSTAAAAELEDHSSSSYLEDFVFASPSRPRWISLRQVFSHLDQHTIDAIDAMEAASGTSSSSSSSPAVVSFLEENLAATNRIELKRSDDGTLLVRSVSVDDHLAQLAFAASNFVLRNGNASDEVMSFCDDLNSQASLRRYIIGKFGSISLGLSAAAKAIPDVCFSVDFSALEENDISISSSLSSTFVDSRCLLARVSDTPPVSPYPSDAVQQQQKELAELSDAQQQQHRRRPRMSYAMLRDERLRRARQNEIHAQERVERDEARRQAREQARKEAIARHKQEQAELLAERQPKGNSSPKSRFNALLQEQQQQGVRSGNSKMIDNAVLAELVPSYFIPTHLLLDKLQSLGYTEQHVRLYWATGRMHPLELVTLVNGKSYVRLIGGKGRFCMSATVELNKQYDGLAPKSALAAPFVDVLVAHQRDPAQRRQEAGWVPLRRLIEMAPPSAVRALPFQHEESLLFFAQMQHIFAFVPSQAPGSGGGMVALRPDADLNSLRFIIDKQQQQIDGGAPAAPEQPALPPPPPSPHEFASLVRATTPCPIFFNQLYHALLEAPYRIPIAELPGHASLDQDAIWREMAEFFPSLEHFIAAHSRCFVAVEDVETGAPTLISYEAFERNQIKFAPYEEQVAYFKKKGDTNALRKLRRKYALENNADSPYRDKTVLAQTIYEALPADGHVVPLPVLKNQILPQEVCDWIPSKGGIVRILQQYPQQFEVVDMDQRRSLLGVRRRSEEEQHQEGGGSPSSSPTSLQRELEPISARRHF